MILDRIVADTRQELEKKKRDMPLEQMRTLAAKQPPPLDLASALGGGGVKLIAEVKKASPSQGVIRRDFNSVEIAMIYAGNGASAISVLTEPKYFQGSLNYLRDIANALGEKRPPLLRKDFIFDPYQVYEARAFGADAFLLIVAILSQQELVELLKLGHELGMKSLVEVHSEAELDIALKAGAAIIGINNRNLLDLTVDLAVTERLRRYIPAGKIVVSESGIKSREDMEKLRKWGVNAALVGEYLMSAQNIEARMRELLDQD